MLRWILVNMTKAIAPVRLDTRPNVLYTASLHQVLCHLAEDIWQFLPPGEKARFAACLVAPTELVSSGTLLGDDPRWWDKVEFRNCAGFRN